MMSVQSPTSSSPPRRSRAPRSPLRGDETELRAMKRALARAPLGPKATLALTHAIIALEDELAPQPGTEAGPGVAPRSRRASD